MRALTAAAALVALAPACSMGEEMRHAKEDAEKAKAEIRSKLGVEALIGYRVFVGTAGKRFDVEVRFVQTPQGAASELKEQVTDIVKRNFRGQVTSVAVSL